MKKNVLVIVAAFASLQMQAQRVLQLEDCRQLALSHNKSLQMAKEKYGEKRGEQSYQSMAEHPNAARGLHFVVGNKIALEKKAMMKLLGKTGNLEDHHYQGLYKLWRSKQGETKSLPDTLELILKAWNPIR